MSREIEIGFKLLINKGVLTEMVAEKKSLSAETRRRGDAAQQSRNEKQDPQHEGTEEAEDRKETDGTVEAKPNNEEMPEDTKSRQTNRRRGTTILGIVSIGGSGHVTMAISRGALNKPP